ncbi:MAG TPA: hypothetical protein DD412_07745 [Holosporales bacterium]|nr:hypothetical protein [Holosporales bacterium]
MYKIILLVTLFSFTVTAQGTSQNVDVKNLTDQQIRFQVFSFMRFSQYKEALAFCNEVLKYKPYSPEAHLGKGNALSELDKWREAVESYNLAIKYNRTPLGEVYYQKGMALDERYTPHEEIENFLKKISLSLEDIKKTLKDIEKSFKDKGVPLEERKKFLEKIWRLEEAFKAYNLALDHGYEDREVYYASTGIRIKLGKP